MEFLSIKSALLQDNFNQDITLTEAVLFQFSRYPQLCTIGKEMLLFKDIWFIYRQSFLDCTAKIQPFFEKESHMLIHRKNSQTRQITEHGADPTHPSCQ